VKHADTEEIDVRDFVEFLHISLGSISELETQLIIANRLGFLNKEEIFPLIEKRTLQAFRANKVPARREKCQKPVTSHASRLTSYV